MASSSAVGVYCRANGRLYIRFKNPRGEWEHQKTPYFKGQEEIAERTYRSIVRDVAARRALAPTGPITLETFATKWLKDRKSLRLKAHADDTTRLKLHVYPTLGHLPLTDIRPRDVRDLVLKLRTAGELAPRTIRHVYGLLVTLFKAAVIEELIQGSPCLLPPGTLPPLEDKDPEWRSGAIFTRAEVEALISDPRIIHDRRTLYALKLLAALRHGEAAGLRWRHYHDGRLIIANSYLRSGTKTGRTREVPVHPTLAAVLAEWRLAWAGVYGRQPGEDDLIVPTRNMTPRPAPDAQVSLLADLAKIGLRHRRGHDLRRTMISLALADGASREHLRYVTHGARAGREAFDLYHTPPWEALVKAVGCLRIERRAGKVYQLHDVSNA